MYTLAHTYSYTCSHFHTHTFTRTRSLSHLFTLTHWLTHVHPHSHTWTFMHTYNFLSVTSHPSALSLTLLAEPQLLSIVLWQCLAYGLCSPVLQLYLSPGASPESIGSQLLPNGSPWLQSPSCLRHQIHSPGHSLSLFYTGANSWAIHNLGTF
jgi:hypothetical protein